MVCLLPQAVQVVREYSGRRNKAIDYNYSAVKEGTVEAFFERVCFENTAFVEASSATESIVPLDMTEAILAYWAVESFDGSLSSEEFQV